MQKNNSITHLILFIMSLSIFIFEILVVRLLSVIFFYETIFIIISLSIFGLGLGGIVFKLFEGNPGFEKIFKYLVIALPFSITLTLISVIKFFYFLKIAVCIGLILIPFILGGNIIAYIYQNNPTNTSTLYFSDLIGGALGCVLSILAVQFFGIVNSILLISLLLTSIPFLINVFLKQKYKIYTLLINLISVLLFLIISIYLNPFELTAKEIKYSDTPLGWTLNYPRIKVDWVRSKWDIYSRTDLVKTDLKYDLRRSVFINGGTETMMIKNNNDATTKRIFKYDITMFPYQFGKNDHVLVIGSGAGRDVLMALVSGAKKVTAVEINENVINITKEEKAYNGDIYSRDGVDLKVEDGRTFILQDKSKYDRIVLSLASTLAFSDVNSIAQMENYLYTEEAFEEYFKHLKDDGTITIFVDFKEVMEKFITSTLSLFEANNIPITEATKNILIFKTTYWSGYSYVMMIRKNPFPMDVINKIISKGEGESGLAGIFVPPFLSENKYDELINGDISLKDYINKSKYNLNPSTDDNPFFLEVVIKKRYHLMILVSILLIITFILIWLSDFGNKFKKNINYQKEIKSNNEKQIAIEKKQMRLYSLYFICIGLGFMMIEIAMTKRFSFYLGYPHLNLAVVMCSILISSGTGAYVTKKIEKDHLNIAGIIGVIIAFFSVLIPLIIPKFIETTINYNLYIRCFFIFFFLFPISFFMGMLFPLGIISLNQNNTLNISWLWGLNGIFSVIGSILSVIIAMIFGFKIVFVIAAIFYLCTTLIGKKILLNR
ncbi:hypothetical protein HZA55_09450 [Candidatus Poribacteria bacterium]|nr:hypothetical protein [Candidatus Poribacteria bacterium]